MRWAWASQIGQGLAAASNAGVPHPDLKPQNVLIVGPDERIKMTDFGVARLRRAAMGSTPTPLGAVMQEYTAPQPVRELRPEVPVALEQALLRALEREPDRRQSGMQEFAESLLELAAAAISERRSRRCQPTAPAASFARSDTRPPEERPGSDVRPGPTAARCGRPRRRRSRTSSRRRTRRHNTARSSRWTCSCGRPIRESG